MAKKRGQNEGSIRKRPDGKWESRITVGVNPNGTPKRKSFYGSTRTEVQKKMTATLNEVNNDQYIEPTKITVAMWFDTWLHEYKRHTIKPTTYVNYYSRVNQHIKPSIGKYKLKDIRADIATVL